jgi:hypothetical protein
VAPVNNIARAAKLAILKIALIENFPLKVRTAEQRDHPSALVGRDQAGTYI